MRFAAVVFLALLLLPKVAIAGPLEVGQTASDRHDYQTALNLWGPLAEKGDADAQDKLSDMYALGQGVTLNKEKAVFWARKAAEQGLDRSQGKLGDMYAYAFGVTQNYSEAAKWFRKAADQGNRVAQFRLGTLYEYGQGIKADYSQAAKWYRLAADQNETDAQKQLGFFYENGQGVNKDIEEAYFWYRVAANCGGCDAVSDSAEIETKLTPKQIEAVKKRVADWKPTPAPAKVTGKPETK